MDQIKQVVGINIVILLAYTLGISFANHGNNMDIGGVMMFLVAGQFFINLIIGIIQYIMKQKAYGHAFMISVAVVGILGFSACFGAMQAFGGGSFH